MDKGSRQIRSVTSGKGLALKVELVGLGPEAGLVPAGLGGASRGEPWTSVGTSLWNVLATRLPSGGRFG
ncbi:MAG: hypothetical protein GY820_10595 [Gammaproteobacteria bacterium]|nr:hypothetical protein [Gammaproteobacteria bacterium]